MFEFGWFVTKIGRLATFTFFKRRKTENKMDKGLNKNGLGISLRWIFVSNEGEPHSEEL